MIRKRIQGQRLEISVKAGLQETFICNGNEVELPENRVCNEVCELHDCNVIYIVDIGHIVRILSQRYINPPPPKKNQILL